VAEPVPTRRELNTSGQGGHGATRREHAQPAPTRRETPGATWSVLSLDAMPARLAGRLSDPVPLPVVGAEAHLLRVRDIAHPDGERVLKVYFPYIEPDRDVWSQLGSIRSKHVVEVVETGRLADGRFFELMEYLPDGSLRDAGAGSRVFAVEDITEMVRQLATGLAALHERGITHRDLKPDNVLVRGTELVLTDFGLSRRLNSSAHFTTGARTSAYAAPEAWAGHVSPARDWWSLGIMVLELATGQQPFHGLDERMIQKAVATRPVPVDGVADARLNRLCAGLLVSDERKRWSGKEVRDWLAGASPGVPDRRLPVDATAFEFDGHRFRDPESLAVAMAGNWRLAARRFGISAGPSWRAFTKWLHQFDDPDLYPAGVVEQRLDLLGRLEKSREKPDAKLVRLLAGLNPGQPPIYRQRHVDAAMLRDLARQAQNGDQDRSGARQAQEIIGEIWDGQLLGVLARFDGAAELGSIRKRWSAAVQQFRDAVATHPRLSAAYSARAHGPIALAATLELAAGAPLGDDWLRALRDRAGALPVPVPWFDELLRWVGTNPIRAYAGLYAAEVARSEAQQTVIEHETAERARRARQQAWADRERRRQAGRAAAVGRAAAGAMVLTGLWLIVVLFAKKTPELALVMVAIAAHFGAELWLANDMAADYHPRYSLWQTVREALGRVGESMVDAPRGWAFGLLALLVLLSFASWLAPLVAVAAAIAHLVWAATRRNRWAAAHQQEHQQVLNQ
jgi:eukaryotic-like serine/threonine-protein kinase